MFLTINGEPRDLPEGLTLSALVQQLGMKADRVAVELNLEIVPRANWDTTTLKDGDKLEIVHFVGGGSGPTSLSTARSQHEADAATGPWTCPSCSAWSETAFCSRCGEKRPSRHDLSIRHLLSHAAETLFHWDSRLLRSFRLLFSQPGLLSADYVAGKRRPYAHPVQVFFVANLLYFLLMPVLGWTGLATPLHVHTTTMIYHSWASRMATHRAAAQGISITEFERRFDHFADVQSRSLVLLVVPMFALVLLALQWRKKKYFGEHLVFALHFAAVWMISVFILIYGGAQLLFVLLRRWGLILRGNNTVDWTLFILSSLALALYLGKAFRRFYGDHRLAGLLKGATFMASTLLVLQVYRFVLFLTALFSA